MLRFWEIISCTEFSASSFTKHSYTVHNRRLTTTLVVPPQPYSSLVWTEDPSYFGDSHISILLKTPSNTQIRNRTHPKNSKFRRFSRSSFHNIIIYATLRRCAQTKIIRNSPFVPHKRRQNKLNLGFDMTELNIHRRNTYGEAITSEGIPRVIRDIETRSRTARQGDLPICSELRRSTSEQPLLWPHVSQNPVSLCKAET